MVCMFVFPASRKRKLSAKMVLKIQLCGIFDMIGNVLSTFAHNYTSAASVALLTSLDSIFSYLLSLLILKAKRTLVEFLSVLFIVLMSITYVLIDNDTQTKLQNQNVFWGDTMALGAALSYSLSSVLYEKYVTDIS